MAHEILSFSRFVLNMFNCFIKAHQSIKKPVLLLWLEGPTFPWVASGYKFYIMNILTRINTKLNIKDISINNTNELYEKRTTKFLSPVNS